MTRKITKDSVKAFLSGENFRRDNTEVRSTGESIHLYLHGSCIATRTPWNGDICINNQGYQTVTTKERLNGLLYALGLAPIYQKNFKWYRDDEEFPSDTWVQIK